MRHWLIAVCLTAVFAAGVIAQIPRLPSVRPGPVKPAPRDTTKDSTRFKWAAPDSVMLGLLARRGYSVTRYQSDTAFFNAQTQVIDLLAAHKHRAAVQRDSQTVVSDSGIYYTAATHHITTGGNYVITRAMVRRTSCRPILVVSTIRWPNARHASRTRACR